MDTYDLSLPPLLLDSLPIDNVIIDCFYSDFYKAVQHLNKQDVIGLSFEGPEISRYSSLEWLCISSACCTFLFDIQKLSKRAFTEGLQSVLENCRLLKVIHDCRRPADCLYHQYGTKLVNVYDTQVAEFVATAQKIKSNDVTEKVQSLNHCLSVYLQVPKEYLHKKCNVACYNNRPLSNELRDLFIKNVIYLRLLRKELNIILRIPYRRCVDIYLQTIQKMTDLELKLEYPDMKSVPNELVLENMQVFKVSEQLVNSANSSNVAKERIDDPYERYKRDCEKYQNERRSINYKNLESCEIQHPFIDNDRYEIIQYLMDKMFSGGVQADSELYDNLSESQISNRRNSFNGRSSLLEQTSLSGCSGISKYTTKLTNSHIRELKECKTPISSKGINEFSGDTNLLKSMPFENCENLEIRDNCISKDVSIKSPPMNLSLSDKLKRLLQLTSQTSAQLTNTTPNCEKLYSQKQSPADRSVLSSDLIKENINLNRPKTEQNKTDSADTSVLSSDLIKENINLNKPKTDLHKSLNNGSSETHSVKNVNLSNPSLSRDNVPSMVNRIRMLLKNYPPPDGSIPKNPSNSDDNSLNKESLLSSTETNVACKDDVHVRPLSVGNYSQNVPSMLTKYKMLLKKPQNSSFSENQNDLDDSSSIEDNNEFSDLSSNTNLVYKDDFNVKKLSLGISSQNTSNLSKLSGSRKVNMPVTEPKNVSRNRNETSRNFDGWSSDEKKSSISKPELSMDNSEDTSNNASEDPWAKFRSAFSDRGPTRTEKLRFVPAGMQC